MTSANPHAQAARTDVSARLATYREARATLHADVLQAARLGMTQAEIARQSGLTVHGVRKILRRTTR